MGGSLVATCAATRSISLKRVKSAKYMAWARSGALTMKARERRGAAQLVPRDQDNASAHFGERFRSDFANPRCTTSDNNSLASHERFYCRDQFTS